MPEEGPSARPAWLSPLLLQPGYNCASPSFLTYFTHLSTGFCHTQLPGSSSSISHSDHIISSYLEFSVGLYLSKTRILPRLQHSGTSSPGLLPARPHISSLSRLGSTLAPATPHSEQSCCWQSSPRCPLCQLETHSRLLSNRKPERGWEHNGVYFSDLLRD